MNIPKIHLKCSQFVSKKEIIEKMFRLFNGFLENSEKYVEYVNLLSHDKLLTQNHFSYECFTSKWESYTLCNQTFYMHYISHDLDMKPFCFAKCRGRTGFSSLNSVSYAVDGEQKKKTHILHIDSRNEKN